jgi:membrane-associated protease RseP (regulator of RpoE activity)
VTVLAFVIGIVVLVVGLAVSIALHELGHLLPAKAFGVRVGQYMIGFGPTIASWRRGETEYGVKALPLGGYISMAGMYADPDDGSRPGRTRLFATMVQDARDANRETMVGAQPHRLFSSLPIGKRVVIMLGGPVMNLLLAIVLMTILMSGFGVQTATATVSSLSECTPATMASDDCVGGVTPAQAAGIQPGDRLVSVDGVQIATFADAAAIIQGAGGRALPMVLERGGERIPVTVTPVPVPATASADAAEVGFVGIRPKVESVRQPLWSGAVAAIENTGAVASVMVRLPVLVYEAGASVITGQERDPNGPLSLVGAGAIAGEVAAADAPVRDRVAGILGLLASVNLALFVFNLIPLLPLDGGHVAIALWDGAARLIARIRGRAAPRPVDATRLVPLTFAVVSLLIVMGGVLILADLLNPVSLV